MKKLKLFGTSGIRGIANTEMTSELANRLGLTFATLLGNQGTVVVGRDVRLSAEVLSSALISGLLLGGVSVQDCGITPTPAILWTLKKRELDGAVVITGSHTPKEIIGFLFFMKDTAELSNEESNHFENIFYSNAKPVVSNQLGKRFDANVSDLYLRTIHNQADISKISSSNFKVVLDPGNGSSASICSNIMQTAGVETIVINSRPNGLFPGRDPYPRPEVLLPLAKKVKESRADIGSATDGDGDRAIFVDNQGRILWGDISGSIFVKDVLLKYGNGNVVAPINSSQLLNWVCDRYNGELTFTRIGPSAIASEIKAKDAIIGIEETGKNIWHNTIFYGDWLLSTLKMLEIMTKEHKSLSDMVKELPKFYTKKKMFYCPDQLKDIVLTQVLKEWKKRGEDADIVTIDGVRINYPDNSWLLFRPSGTEAVFRVYFESQELQRLQELENVALKLVKKVIKSTNLKSNGVKTISNK